MISKYLLGSVLFIWQVNAPYLLTGALLVTIALVIYALPGGIDGLTRKAIGGKP